MIKKIYWYIDDNQLVSSHDIPSNNTQYLEKTINIIGVPDLRAVSIKDSRGKLLYNNIEILPLENNLIERYFMEIDHEKRIN